MIVSYDTIINTLISILKYEYYTFYVLYVEWEIIMKMKIQNQ